jgi:hypothetical protein
MFKSLLRLRKFLRRSIITATPFDERLSHHEDREGREDRITERASNLKKTFSPFVLFVCFVVISIFLLVAAPRARFSAVILVGVIFIIDIRF